MTEPSAEFDRDANRDIESDQPATNSDSMADANGDHAISTSSPADAGAAAVGSPSSNIMILWPEPSDFSARASSRERANDPQPARPSARRRRRVAIAAMAALAALCGAAGGSLATFAIGKLTGAAVMPAVTADAESNARVRDALARVTADVGGLRADFDRASHVRTAQITKFGDRLDKVEKSQDDTVVRLAKLSEAQDKLQDKAQDRMHTAAAPAPADVTGSISSAVAPKGDLRVDPKRPQVVEGWTLSQVTNGGAIVRGPDGLYEAFPGDPLPGIGRVDAVRYQDGRWVVMTPKGVIIHR
ncbi:MAG: hypothetical protein P4M07_11620 [Xanthobacteraceae bacterium]|nr:hypothetical protein [Xanthobacteraceae bacterium]